MTFETWLLMGAFIAALASFAGGPIRRRRDELADARRTLLRALDMQQQFRARASTEHALLEQAIRSLRAFRSRIVERKVVERDMLSRYRASSEVHSLLFRNLSKIALLTSELSDPRQATTEPSELRARPSQFITEASADWFLRSNSGAMTRTERAECLQWLSASPVHIAEFLRVWRYHTCLSTLKPLAGVEAKNVSVPELRPLLGIQRQRLKAQWRGPVQPRAAPFRERVPIVAILPVSIGSFSISWSVLHEANASVSAEISVLVPAVALIVGAMIGLRAVRRVP